MAAPGHTSYLTSDYTAFAIEKQLQKKWVFQYVSACPLLACIHDGELHWNKGYTVSELAALVPIVMTGISTLNSGNLGVSDANEIPTGWPSYDQTQGFSQARYEFCHTRRPMTVRESERVIAGGNGGHRGALIEGKVAQLMADWSQIFGAWVIGNQNGTRTQLLGAEHVIATANTVGGIDQSQAQNANWRAAFVTPTGGAVSLANIYTDVDADDIATDEKGNPGGFDLMTCSYTAGGVNVYGAVRGLIDDAERFVNNDFFTKYGIKHWMLLGMKVVKENRQASGTIFYFDTKQWLWGGNETPQAQRPIRIPGSDAEERMYNSWNFLGCKSPRRNGRRTTITG